MLYGCLQLLDILSSTFSEGGLGLSIALLSLLRRCVYLIFNLNISINCAKEIRVGVEVHIQACVRLCASGLALALEQLTRLRHLVLVTSE
jgi:hypothetical protein